MSQKDAQLTWRNGEAGKLPSAGCCGLREHSKRNELFDCSSQSPMVVSSLRSGSVRTLCARCNTIPVLRNLCESVDYGVMEIGESCCAKGSKLKFVQTQLTEYFSSAFV